MQISQPQLQKLNKSIQGSISIGGYLYENVRILNSNGTQTDNFIANIKGNENEEFVIKQYKTINEAELLAIKEIKRLQNEQEPKCLNIIKIIELQDNRRISSLQKNSSIYVVLEKGKNNVEELIKSISFTILSQQQKLNYFAQMLQGVKELHDIGYFHRDLKPENFVYFENSNQEIQIKLIDFGSVKRDSEINTTLQTGTFNYMAPEVIKNNTNYDKTADIWSLGIICYEIVTKADFLEGNNSKDFTKSLSKLTQELVNERIKNTNNIDDFTKSLLLQMLQIQGDKRAKLKSLIDQIKLNQKVNDIILVLESQKNTITMFISYLNQKLEYINDIDEEVQNKNEMIFLINRELDTQNQKLKENEQKKLQICQDFQQEQYKAQDYKIAQEVAQDLSEQNNFIKQITEQEILLQKQVSLMAQLQFQQNNISIFRSNLEEKLLDLKKINIENTEKNDLMNLIDNELQKQNQKLEQNLQRRLDIYQASLLEQLKGYDNKIAFEVSNDQQEQFKFINQISQKQKSLENQVSNKSIIYQQLEENQQIYEEQKLNKEKEKFYFQFTNLQNYCYSFQGNIQKYQQRIMLYNLIQYQMQGQGKLKKIIGDYDKIIQELIFLQQQEQKINQLGLSLQIIEYQSFQKKFYELQNALDRIKNSIDETNEFIEEIDSKFIYEFRIKIQELAYSLNNYWEKFQYLSKNQKYKNKIDQVISKIRNCFNKLNNLDYWLTKTILNYQYFNVIMNSINQDLLEFHKQHDQLHQQIYEDKQIELQNVERIKKLTNIEGQLKVYKDQMDTLKIQINNFINNQYCDNQFTKDLIKNEQIKIDQNMNQIKKQFTNFKEFNQFTLEEINNQIKQLEQFEEKLKKQLEDEQKQANQIQLEILKIEAENKSKQEKEFFQLTYELQKKYSQSSKSLQSVNIKQGKVLYLKKIQQKREGLLNQLKQEIETLKNYLEVNQSNLKLFNQKLEKLQKHSGICGEQVKLLQKQKNSSLDKIQKLEQVLKNVQNKPNELYIQNMDNNLIYQYEKLKQKEQQLQSRIDNIISQSKNSSLIPSQFDQLKKKICDLSSEVDQLIEEIPNQNQIQQFKSYYKINVELYEKLQALVNYIMQYHLTRYYERIKENAVKMKNKQQNFQQNSYFVAFQDKQNEKMEQSTLKEKEAQDLLKIYENILFHNYNKKMIDEMEKDYEQIKKQIENQENHIKQQELVKLRVVVKDKQAIKEIINEKQYYKIKEFSQMLIFEISLNKKQQDI